MRLIDALLPEPSSQEERGQRHEHGDPSSPCLSDQENQIISSQPHGDEGPNEALVDANLREREWLGLLTCYGIYRDEDNPEVLEKALKVQHVTEIPQAPMVPQALEVHSNKLA